MVDRIRRFQVLNSQIFSMLNKYLSSGTIDSNQVEQIKCFNPPSFPKQGNTSLIGFLILIYFIVVKMGNQAPAQPPIYMRADILLGHQKHPE